MQKHAYGGRACMACGGKACNVSYEQLRNQVEAHRKAPMDGERAGIDSKPSIAKGMMMPLGHYVDGGKVESTQPEVTKPKVDKDGYDSNGNKVQKDTAAIDSVNHALGNYADGGDVEDMDMGKDDDMLMDHCVGECMEAIKSGDKAAFKDAMHTMMADFMGKMGKED